MICAEQGCKEKIVSSLRIASGERGGPADYTEAFFCSWACIVSYAARKWYGKDDKVLPVKLYKGYTEVGTPTLPIDLLTPYHRERYEASLPGTGPMGTYAAE